MGLMQIILGTTATIAGVLIIFTPAIFVGIFLTGIGIALVIFNKEEDKIERRKDQKNAK
jgi:hypothetical protein